MNTFDAQKMNCPNCGNNVTLVAAFGEHVRCPFCHQQTLQPHVTYLQVPVAEDGLTFSVTKADFCRHVVDKLVDTPYVPTDIFSTVSPQKMKRAYLPMYMYEGMFKAKWTCKVQTQVVGNDGKKLKEYKPSDGTASGTFFFLLSAYEGRDIAPEIVKFAESIPFTPSDFKSMDSPRKPIDEQENAYTWEINTVALSQFSSKGAAKVADSVGAAVDKQLGDKKVKGLNITHTHNLKTAGQLVMVPLWFIYYFYQNKQYYFLMDGKGKHTAQSIPLDKNATSTVKNRYRREVALDIALAVAVLLVVLGLQSLLNVKLFSSLITWIVVLAAWGYLGVRVWMALRHKRNALSEAKEIRRAAATQLLARFDNKGE